MKCEEWLAEADADRDYFHADQTRGSEMPPLVEQDGEKQRQNEQHGAANKID